MRILFIRHGDPDYENDTLTEKGRREAALLAQMAPSMKIDDCYMSPLGRAHGILFFKGHGEDGRGS